jgi:holo-[acyl-carrier protein] synthase
MIVGTGIDVEKINRVARLVDEHAARLDEVFTKRERIFCEDASSAVRLARYTAAFALKEAVMKALGTGWGGSVEWLEIDTPAHPRDELRLHGETARFAVSQKVGRIIVSVSATRGIVTATAIAESANEELSV